MVWHATLETAFRLNPLGTFQVVSKSKITFHPSDRYNIHPRTDISNHVLR